jgi:glycosyltransferase involved in cell wall biosynthesis
MNKKIITVIIPTYNRIIRKEIVKSFFHFKKFIKIIIVDDGSSIRIMNYNKKILDTFSKISFIKLNRNRGQSYACNQGLKKTNTKYVWFFDDDDTVNNKSIKNIISTLILKNAGGGYLLPACKMYNNIKIKTIYPEVRPHNFNDLRNNGQLVNTSCAIFKTSIIKKINGWDENLYGGTDTDLFLRYSMHSNFLFLKTFPIKINIAINNRLTNKIFRQQKAKIFFLLKHWKVLTIKRKFYYIFSLLFFFPLFYTFKDSLMLLLAKIKNNVRLNVQE